MKQSEKQAIEETTVIFEKTIEMLHHRMDHVPPKFKSRIVHLCQSIAFLGLDLNEFLENNAQSVPTLPSLKKDDKNNKPKKENGILNQFANLDFDS